MFILFDQWFSNAVLKNISLTTWLSGLLKSETGNGSGKLKPIWYEYTEVESRFKIRNFVGIVLGLSLRATKYIIIFRPYGHK